METGKLKSIIDFLITLPLKQILEIQNDMNKNEKVINVQLLAEHLINGGDSTYSFDCSDFLADKFKDYAFSILCEYYSKEEVSNIVNNSSNVDFLMDDWDDIIPELFDKFIRICPGCGCVIWENDKDGYIYETGKTEYICSVCETSIYV